MGRRWAILLTSIRKVCKFVHFTGGEKVSNFAHFSQENVQIFSLYWWGEGEQICSLLKGKCANLFTLVVGRRWAILLTSVRKVCKFVHFTGGEKVSNFAHFSQESVQICSLYWWGEFLSGMCANLFTLLVGRNWAILLTSVRKVCKFVHFTGGEKVSNFAHFYQESVQICSLYWWGEGEQFCSLQSGKCANLFTLLVGRRWAILLTSVRKVCKLVHFTDGENFYKESVQICWLYWWGEVEQFCSLQSGKCANLFTLLVGRRWAILLTSIRKVCKFVHFTGGEEVSNFAHFSQESVQICSLYLWGEGQESVQTCSLYWWGEGEQFCSLHTGKCANLFTLLVGRRWAILLTSIRKVCKFVHFTGGEVRNFAHFSQESVQICSLYWWGEGEQFCSLQSAKCANLFTLLVGRRWAILLTSVRKVCKFVHFTGGEKVSNFAHFFQESVQICSLYWWERGEQYSAHFSHGEGEQICTPIGEVEKFAHIESYSAVSCQHIHKFVKNESENLHTFRLYFVLPIVFLYT